MPDPTALRQEILRLTRVYSRQVHAPFRPAVDPDRQPWQPGTTIP
jgi:CDP-6-deoxy-D-xylo-4-hexulose-3-dehydrase